MFDTRSTDAWIATAKQNLLACRTGVTSCCTHDNDVYLARKRWNDFFARTAINDWVVWNELGGTLAATRSVAAHLFVKEHFARHLWSHALLRTFRLGRTGFGLCTGCCDGIRPSNREPCRCQEHSCKQTTHHDCEVVAVPPQHNSSWFAMLVCSWHLPSWPMPAAQTATKIFVGQRALFPARVVVENLRV